MKSVVQVAFNFEMKNSIDWKINIYLFQECNKKFHKSQRFEVQILILYTNLDFIPCVFSNVFSNYPARRMRSYIIDFSPLWMFRWYFKLSAWTLGKWHWLHFLHCAFSNVSSNYLHGWMHNYIPCICSIFLPYVLSCVSSNYLSMTMHNCIGCIYSIFLHCASLNVSWDYSYKGMHNCIRCICLICLHCVF